MEMNYRKLLEQMMTPYDEMLQSLIGDHADFSKVDYLEKHSEKYGKSDANYTNPLEGAFGYVQSRGSICPALRTDC